MPETVSDRNKVNANLAKVYFWSIAILGIVSFILTFLSTEDNNFNYKNTLEFLFFIVLNILAEISIIRIPTGGSLTASFSVILTVLLVQGPLYAIISAVTGASISAIFTQKRTWKIVVFNSALFSIIFSIAGQFSGFLQKIFIINEDDQIFSMFIIAFAVTAIYMILSSVIVNTYICITTGLKFLDTLKEDKWEFTQLAILTPISVLGVYFYYSIGIFATLAAFFPAIITVYGIRNYISMNNSNANLKSFSEDLEQLYYISKKISSQIRMQDLWRMVSSETKFLIPYDRCSVYLLNKNLTTLVFAESDVVYTGLEEYDLLEDGPLQKCVAKRVTVTNNDFRSLPSYKNWNDIKSFILEPVIVSGEVIGVVSLLSTEKDAFTYEHQKFIRLLISSMENTIKSINLFEQTQKQALIDGLTQLYNQKYFKNQVGSELIRANQQKHNTSVIMFDVDYFKKFNDTHGHLLGDLVLKDIAKILKSFVKSTYVASRYGGEEFALLLPETKLDDACEIAENIRKKIKEYKFMGREQREVNLSVSMGVNCHHTSMGEITKIEFIDRADTALYRAKNEGRNQVFKSLYSKDNDQLILKKYTKEEETIKEKKGLYVFTLDKSACKEWIIIFDKFNLWIKSEENIQIRSINEVYQAFFLNLIKNKLESVDKKITTLEEEQIQSKILERLYFPTDFYKFEIEIEDLEKLLFDYISNIKTAEIEKEFIRKIIIGIFNKVYAMAVKYTSNHYQKIVDFHTNIAHINSEIGSISTKNTFYANISKLTSEIISTKFAFIAEIDGHNKGFSIKSFYGVNEFQTYNPNNIISEKLLNRILNYTDSIQIYHEEINEAFNKEFIEKTQIKSSLIVPLVKYDKEISGILVCLDDKERQFFPEEINICKEIAERVIKAISRIEKSDSEKDSYVEIIKSMIDIFESSDIKSKDHSKNISRLSGRIANIIGLSKEDENDLRVSAYLHDIGKLSTKQDQSAEFMKSHPVIGARIVGNSQELKKLSPIILYHHEHWDGSGYPDGLSGKSIPLYSRIICIANAYENIIRDGLTHTLAIEKMIESGLYDPSICNAIKDKNL